MKIELAGRLDVSLRHSATLSIPSEVTRICGHLDKQLFGDIHCMIHPGSEMD